MAEYPTRFKSSSTSLSSYMISCTNTCTLDTHNCEKLNLIYVNNVIYKQQFCQLNLHDMCLSVVENPSLPPKHSWTIRLTAVDSQWLLKSFRTVNQCCSFYYNFTTAYLVKEFRTFMESKFPLPYGNITLF
jgi:hypothetical protein